MSKPLSQFVQDSNGDWSATRLTYLGSFAVSSIAIFTMLYIDAEEVPAMVRDMAAVFAALGAFNRYQERKENVVENAKPTDTTNVDVSA